MTGDVIRHIDEIGGLDEGIPESEVGDGDPSGFLRVIGEIPLCILVGIVTDDLDSILVRTHCPVPS